MNQSPLSGQEEQVVATMDALCSNVLNPGDQRIYSLLIEGYAALADLDLRHAGSAYLLWAGISDLLDSPWGPGSEDACDWMARRVATDWFQTDRRSYQSIEEYFESWLAQLQSFVWPLPAVE